MILRRWSPGPLLFGALAGLSLSAASCTPPSTAQPMSGRYIVKVHCHTQEGRAVQGVLLHGNRSSMRTDVRGIADLIFDGREGDEVSFKVEKVPYGLELADQISVRQIVLRRYGSETDATGANIIPADITLRNRKDPYVVFVHADQAANLQVLANGKPAARLNSRGASAFRYEAKPGEELVVAISTQNEPRASQQNPKKVFKLSMDEHILLFHSDLTIAPLPQPSGPVQHKKKTVKKAIEILPVAWGKSGHKKPGR